MANLYCEIESERCGKHAIGNRFLEIKIFYGSRENSKLLTHIVVNAESQLEPKFFQYNTIQPRPMILQNKPLEVTVK